MSFSYRFHGNGSTLSWVDLYHLKDIDIIRFTVLREKDRDTEGIKEIKKRRGMKVRNSPLNLGGPFPVVLKQ